MKGTPTFEFGYEILRIHSCMICIDSIEYKIVGDTKVRSLRCFPFNPHLKAGDMIATGEYINYQTFSNLNFNQLCIHWVVNWKSILVSALRSQTKFNTQKKSVNRGFFLYVKARKAMELQDDILSNPIDISENHHVLLFDSTSIQDATENFHFSKPVGEPLF